MSGFAFLVCGSAKISIRFERDDWFGIHQAFGSAEGVLVLRCCESVALALHSLQAEHMTSTTSSIRWSPTTPLARIRVEELMDDPALDPREHHAALAGLKRLNAWSKSARILWPSIGPVVSSVCYSVISGNKGQLALGEEWIYRAVAHHALGEGFGHSVGDR